MRQKILRALPWLIGIALFVWVLRTVTLADVLAVLRELGLWEIGVLILANAAFLVAITSRWWLLLRGLGYRVPFSSLFRYRFAAFGLSYFTPGPHLGGEPLQILLVNRRHEVPRPAALAAVSLDKSLEIAINFAMLLVGVALVGHWQLLGVAAGWQVTVVLAVLLFLPLGYLVAAAAGKQPLTALFRLLPGWRPPRRWSGSLEAAAAAVASSEAQMTRFMRRSPGTLALALLATALSWLAMIIEYWLMVYFLGVRLTLPQLVTTMVAARIAILSPLPADMGVLEFSQAFAFGALGLDPAVGTSVSLLIRARDTLLGALGLWLGGRDLRSGAGPATTADQP